MEFKPMTSWSQDMGFNHIPAMDKLAFSVFEHSDPHTKVKLTFGLVGHLKSWLKKSTIGNSTNSKFDLIQLPVKQKRQIFCQTFHLIILDMIWCDPSNVRSSSIMWPVELLGLGQYKKHIFTHIFLNQNLTAIESNFFTLCQFRCWPQKILNVFNP